MIKLRQGSLDLALCQANLNEFKDLLDTRQEIEETGSGSLQEFFTSRMSLLLLMGESFGAGLWPAQYQNEPVLFNEFRADYVVCDATRKKFLFIEFEDAKANSIFEVKNDRRTGTSYQWSRRFEHGLSQVVDWHFRIDDYRRTSKLQEHFGSDDIAFQGVLIIGRDHFLQQQGNRRRFDWRVEKTTIDSRSIHCLTFDKLYREMAGRLENLRLVGSGGIT
jgi:hypothetical protein